ACDGWGVRAEPYVSSSRSQSAIGAPLVLPQGLWFAGLAFCVAVAVLLLARSLVAFLKGDLATLFEAIGSKSAVAEAKEEITAIEHALGGKPGEWPQPSRS